jgi:LysR family hydrogen peroxide-inducible transcriptional activator
MIIHEKTTQQLLRGIEEHDLDLALISDAPLNPRIEIQQLFSGTLSLSAGGALIGSAQESGRRRFTGREIYSDAGGAHCLGSQVRQFCHSKGFQPEISCRNAQIGTVLAMVEAGLGISLIPKMALPRPSKDRIICRSLDGVRPRRTLALAWSGQRKLSLCVREFTKVVRD